MPRTSFTPRHPSHAAAGAFTIDEWQRLTGLPAEVMIMAVATFGRRCTVAEGLAGLDAIAAGRAYDSDLVRAVVAAIYAEPEPEVERSYPTERARVLADCRRVSRILRAHADPADAAAYKHWVQQVAVRVCRAAFPRPEQSGAPATGGSLLDDLAAALV